MHACMDQKQWYIILRPNNYFALQILVLSRHWVASVYSAVQNSCRECQRLCQEIFLDLPALDNGESLTTWCTVGDWISVVLLSAFATAAAVSTTLSLRFLFCSSLRCFLLGVTRRIYCRHFGRYLFAWMATLHYHNEPRVCMYCTSKLLVSQLNLQFWIFSFLLFTFGAFHTTTLYQD